MPGFSRAGTLFAIAYLISALWGGVWAQSVSATAGSPEARDLGIQSTRAGDYEESYSLLLPWVRTNPDDFEARLYASWSAAFLGRTYEAADLLNGLDERDPRVQFLWGKLLLDKRDPQGAIELLEPLVQTAPPELDLQVRRLLARAWMAVGQADRAVPLLEGRVGGDPAMTLDLALAKYEAGDIQGARELLAPFAEAALNRFQSGDSTLVDALSVAVMYEYGRSLVTTARHTEAIPFLEASVQLAPGCKQCWQQMAQAYAAGGRREEAQSARRRFEEILRSEVPAEEKQRQEASDQQDPTGKVLREALEVFRAGKTDEALAMLQAESRLRPSDPRTMLLAAQILVDSGRAQQALVLAESALQLAPGFADGYFIRGTILQALGQGLEARRDFNRALELDPNHRQAAESLEQLSPQ